MKADQMQSLVDNMALLFGSSGVVVALFDCQDKLVYANRAFRELTNLAEDEYLYWPDLIRRNYQSPEGLHIETEDVEAWLDSAYDRRWKLPYREFELDLKDGRWIQLAETMIPETGLLAIGIEITSSKTAVSKLRRDYVQAMVTAETDPLTGLGNRRALERLTSLLENAVHQSGVSILIIDIDQFKEFNDQYGHLAGDDCLRQVAKAIQSGLRESGDYALRIGGDEFLVVLHDTPMQVALNIAERIRLRLVESALPHEDMPDGVVTVSVGVARAERLEAGSINALIKKADQALYEAKQAGRNQVLVRSD
ncbi:MAG: sensor domain-containing diguanylate cyclase [Natronospirillum sp.]|uniref:sensor domain-containing diguanylate cyclase n=1 Tax=Natronospirillum sp. TaxID=2812955 RepID=UPI0025F275DD|nr:sensor domain-containing diguanylate cyclase [Natronospirillum sp.]MCH8552132.1 sensor domain-containing diguanylate cyclase [Natronospirillum sp.]